MNPNHAYALGIYALFALTGTGLALLRRRPQAASAPGSVWKKYPGYLLITLTFIVACWLPREWQALTILLAVVGGLAGWELARALLPRGVARILLAGSAAVLPIAALWFEGPLLVKTWVALVFGALALSALSVERERLGRMLLAIVGCMIYLPLCLAVFGWMRAQMDGGFTASFLYMIVATNDAFAQIIGQWFGRRPLAPRLSPAKTVEGALGGIGFAAGMGALLSGTVGWPMMAGAALGAVLGAAGLTGDLIESAVKRALGLKNFGQLLGAQGGVLDRFDGLLFAALVFWLVR